MYQCQKVRENNSVSKSKWSFIGGFAAGMLVTVLLTAQLLLATASCGFITYMLLEKPVFFSGKTTKTIDAREGWQDTGVRVKPGTKIDISVIEGKWTHWSGSQPLNPGVGGGYICGKAMKPEDCVEPLPEYPAGGLIGKIGDQVFGVGMGISQVSTGSGTLKLRINDADVGLYDNDGELKVEIQVGK
jgi:hypothetical protein